VKRKNLLSQEFKARRIIIFIIKIKGAGNKFVLFKFYKNKFYKIHLAKKTTTQRPSRNLRGNRSDSKKQIKNNKELKSRRFQN